MGKDSGIYEPEGGRGRRLAKLFFCVSDELFSKCVSSKTVYAQNIHKGNIREEKTSTVKIIYGQTQADNRLYLWLISPCYTKCQHILTWYIVYITSCNLLYHTKSH